jgi:hypothetical protein
VIDLSVLRLLLVAVVGWLDGREREAIAYLTEENRFFADRSVRGVSVDRR